MTNPNQERTMPSVPIIRETYRDVTITIEQVAHPDGDTVSYAAYAPLRNVKGWPGYLDRYFTSEVEALSAAKALIDSHATMLLQDAATKMVDDVTDAICDLVRAVTYGDASLYRPMLERCAERLGGV